MRISLITTVLNEENSIKMFIDSVLKQSMLPDELIIVDGGSSDRTVANIKYQILNIKYKTKIKLLVEKGNRSVGRNTAIKNSNFDIIAVSDIGCVLDKNWLANITDPFKDKSIDVVSGYYKPITHSTFEKCLASYTCVMPDKVDRENFLPSSRSIAFQKSAWKKVGGYPEDLDTCEDLVFAKKMKKMGLKFSLTKSATVFWPQKKNIFQAGKQFFNYAIGDGQALYIRSQTPFLFTRYFFGLTLIVAYLMTKSNLLLSIIYYLITAYLVWSIWKNYKYVKRPKAFLYLPVLQITSDLAVILGMTIGFLKRFWR